MSRVLVVDDQPDVIDLVSMLLEQDGHMCAKAETGRGALDVAELFDPHVVLLDIGLPDLSGLEVARILRTRRGSSLYIAAITGWGTERDRSLAIAAGFDRHMVKPASRAAIREIMIEAALRRRDGAAT